MRLICALSIAFVLGATPAFADDPPLYEPKLVPKCKLAKVAGGGETCGYTLGEWKLVLEVDAELVSKRTLLAKEKERTAALTLQVTNLESQVAVYVKSQKLLVDRTHELTTDIIEIDRKYQNERVKPRLGSPLAWTVAAVSTAVLGGFVVKGWVD